MISFVENKPVNWDFIENTLNRSVLSNHWTNFGPVSILLEERLADILNINQDKSAVVACASGTLALFALVEMHNHLAGKELRWVVSSFNFHCAKQGPLKKAKVIDCDQKGMINLDLIGDDEYDAILITNPFGVVDSVKKYKKKGKIVICDSCSAFDALPDHDVNEVISLHHTKPWGFGEGGCAVIEKKYYELFRAIINFGKWKTQSIKNTAFNGKMSDPAASFILQRLATVDQMRRDYIEQYERVVRIGVKFGKTPLITRKIKHIPHCVPLLSNCPPSLDNAYIKLHRYYQPIDDSSVANDIYNRIICFPCHPELRVLSDSILESVLSC